jgi:hypothetical protein
MCRAMVLRGYCNITRTARQQMIYKAGTVRYNVTLRLVLAQIVAV